MFPIRAFLNRMIFPKYFLGCDALVKKFRFFRKQNFRPAKKSCTRNPYFSSFWISSTWWSDWMSTTSSARIYSTRWAGRRSYNNLPLNLNCSKQTLVSFGIFVINFFFAKLFPGKTYQNMSHEVNAFTNFHQNMQFIQAHNNGTSKYNLSANHLIDMVVVVFFFVKREKTPSFSRPLNWVVCEGRSPNWRCRIWLHCRRQRQSLTVRSTAAVDVNHCLPVSTGARVAMWRRWRIRAIADVAMLFRR